MYVHRQERIKVYQYHLCCGNTMEELESDVNGMLAEGWRCQGGPTVSKDTVFYQAMILETEEIVNVSSIDVQYDASGEKE